MATATKTKTELVPAKEQVITYTPIGEENPVHLTISQVRKDFTRPTKSGAEADDSVVKKFIKTCQARGLNPWLNDCYLVGYDAHNGPEFSLITSINALYKRAELNPQYNGIESGVIVKVGNSREFHEGDFVDYSEEVLLGGWARVHRKDQQFPIFEAISLQSREKGTSVWKADKSGMIVKCAEAAALRRAFTMELSELFIRDEIRHDNAVVEAESTPVVDSRSIAGALTSPQAAQNAHLTNDDAQLAAAQEKARTAMKTPYESFAGFIANATAEQIQDIYADVIQSGEHGEITEKEMETLVASINEKQAAFDKKAEGKLL